MQRLEVAAVAASKALGALEQVRVKLRQHLEQSVPGTSSRASRACEALREAILAKRRTREELSALILDKLTSWLLMRPAQDLCTSAVKVLREALLQKEGGDDSCSLSSPQRAMLLCFVRGFTASTASLPAKEKQVMVNRRRVAPDDIDSGPAQGGANGSWSCCSNLWRRPRSCRSTRELRQNCPSLPRPPLLTSCS